MRTGSSGRLQRIDMLVLSQVPFTKINEDNKPYPQLREADKTHIQAGLYKVKRAKLMLTLRLLTQRKAKAKLIV